MPSASKELDPDDNARLFGVDDALDTDAWYTPPWIFEGLGVTFDLDVAAPAEPLGWIPAKCSYTVAQDGLLLPWDGLVWCNPPYSNPRPWCEKWAGHPTGLLLVRSDLSTSLFVAPKRIQFVNGHGVGSGSVNFSSVLLGRGETADRAILRLAACSGGVARFLKAES